MIDKLEVGKKYRLVDKEGYLSYDRNQYYNKRIMEEGYFDSDLCVVVDVIDRDGWGKSSGEYVISPEEFRFFEQVEENIENEEPKAITPETEVTITTTYGELARVYYVMGNVNGKKRGRTLWATVADVLGDSNHSIYWENEPNNPSINYLSVQKEWESLFFKSKEQQEKELAIKQKQDMIEQLQKEIQELGGE